MVRERIVVLLVGLCFCVVLAGMILGRSSPSIGIGAAPAVAAPTPTAHATAKAVVRCWGEIECSSVHGVNCRFSGTTGELDGDINLVYWIVADTVTATFTGSEVANVDGVNFPGAPAEFFPIKGSYKIKAPPAVSPGAICFDTTVTSSVTGFMAQHFRGCLAANGNSKSVSTDSDRSLICESEPAP